MKKLLSFFLIFLSVLSCQDFLNLGNQNNQVNKPEDNPEEKPGDKPGDREFVLLFTNDFHSQIEPTSKDASYNADRGGVVRLKALIDSVKAVEPSVLLTDSGDLVQGTYYFSCLNGIVEMMVLDELGYDVRTLGNHEFDKKMVGLGDMLSMSKVPVVASNYDFSNTSLSQYVKSSVILKAGDVNVGFIGLNVRLQNLVDPSACEGVVWFNALDVADQLAGKLKKDGADIVIALSHLGFSKDTEVKYMDSGVAKNTRNIDMIVGGHSHTFLNKAYYVRNLDEINVPIVQTGSKGICLGYSKIKIDKDGNKSFKYRLIPVDSRLDAKVDEAFAATISTYAGTLAEKMEEVIGYAPEDMTKGTPESKLGNFTADALSWMCEQLHGSKPDVTLYNTGGLRSYIYRGPVTLGDVFSVYPFDNQLTVLEMTGTALKNLFSEVAASGGMPINAGVRLVIKDGKVKSVTVNGRQIEDGNTYIVATLDYVVNNARYGTGDYLVRKDSSQIIYDLMADYIRWLTANGKNVESALDGRITIE
ncbi:MAG: bifunctional UDP-sugar hydrolase/5'-nucleotidase [Candidatus Cryptobacteroides sp.]|nr:bifunctional UDP-sugar hydrolase/5'-nucleotidase [Candidatus Cryptobacteroides sp.]